MTRKADAEIDIKAVYENHAADLRWFVAGLLRNESLVDDALQAAFLKLAEKSDTLRDAGAVRSWLFQVAFNEAMLVKRKTRIRKQHQEKVALFADSRRGDSLPTPDHSSMKKEQSQQVQLALESLTADQRKVVSKRIYEGLKFREIAEQLDVPLGTVLARMQASLKKLRPILEPTYGNE